MIWRRTYRRKSSRGFALAEALVSLSVAAVTLALLTSATWGLRQAAPSNTEIQQEASDWLTARRVLQAWTSAATTPGVTQTEGLFTGTPTEMRLIISDPGGRRARPMMVSLRVEKDGDLYSLIAAQHFNVTDTRVLQSEPRDSTVITSRTPLRIVYQTRNPTGPGVAWVYDMKPELGLPSAIGIEMGNTRMITARLPATRSASCIAALGKGGVEGRECYLR